jgi:outer membrane biosynthesis protein TonB
MAASNQFREFSAILGQRLQDWRRTPSAVAALASLGLHGLVLAALPFLANVGMSADEPEIRRPVPVVELTPEEQNRLPDFTLNPPLELPPISQAPTANDLLGTPAIPNLPSSQPSQSSSSLLAPPVPLFIPPPLPITEIPSFSIPFPTLPSRPTRPAAPAPVPEPTQSPTASPSPSPSPEGVTESSPSSTVAVEPGPETPAEGAAEPSPTARTEEQIRQDLVARQQELRALYTYNGAGTTVEDANVAFADWFYQNLGKQDQDYDKLQQAKMTLSYPRVACPLKQTRSAVVGVIVDAENNIVAEPKVIQSSGYALFNQEALKAVETYTFENTTGGEQPYLVTVTFEYSEEVCPAGLAPQEPTS